MATQLRLVRFDTRTLPQQEDLLDRFALARATGLHPHVIERLQDAGILEPRGGTPDEPLFDPAVVVRLQRIARMREELDLSWTAIGLVTELMSRIEALEARVRDLERPERRARPRRRTRAHDAMKL